MAGIRIILLPLGPASRTIFARLSTFRRHELSLLLFSFSLLAPGTHDTHCSCDDQRATISLSPRVLRRWWYRFSPVYSPGSLPPPPPPSLFSFPLSLSLSSSRNGVKRFQFHGFGTRWNCPFLVYRPIRASFSRRFEGNFDSGTNLLSNVVEIIVGLKKFWEKFWSIEIEVEKLNRCYYYYYYCLSNCSFSFIAFIREL